MTTSEDDCDEDGELPLLTPDEPAQLRPAREVLPSEVFAALPSRGGRPKSEEPRCC